MYPALRLVIPETSLLRTTNGRNGKQLIEDERRRKKTRNCEEIERRAAKESEGISKNIERKTEKVGGKNEQVKTKIK
jgi:hypothetical protein